MDFQFTDEQRLLAESVGGYADARASGGDAWRNLVDMGLPGLLIDPEQGGLGLGAVETMIVAGAFGRGLVRTPFISSSIVGAALLGHCRDDVRAALLDGVIGGDVILALAILERDGRFDPGMVETCAKPIGTGFTVSGRKANVLYGDEATHLIVSAQVSQGIGLFVVERDQPGLTVTGYPTLDGQRCADILFEDVAVEADWIIGGAGEGLPMLERALDRGAAAACAEAVGAMSRLCDLTFEYLKTRRQFGRPIGQFQALQHRAADMLIGLEQSRSAAIMAAAGVDDGDFAKGRRLVSAAKAVTGKWSRFVGQQAIQLHGGIGTTEELLVGQYVKRLIALDLAYGDASHHVARYASEAL
jgi:alkylation response protein AidB-like acyl-CoA dehydrogenase